MLETTSFRNSKLRFKRETSEMTEGKILLAAENQNHHPLKYLIN